MIDAIGCVKDIKKNNLVVFYIKISEIYPLNKQDNSLLWITTSS